jgi:hypothetical protein
MIIFAVLMDDSGLTFQGAGGAHSEVPHLCMHVVNGFNGPFLPLLAVPVTAAQPFNCHRVERLRANCGIQQGGPP